MRLASLIFAFAAVPLAVAACGTDIRPEPTAGDDGVDTGDTPDGYTTLIARTWSVEPGNYAKYACARVTIPEDMYITNIQAQAPAGTHHTVVTFAGANGTAGADGDQDDCGVATLGMVMLYASGVGTDSLDFPDGVGVKISAGQQLHLNLHLANPGDEPLEGETAVMVKATRTPPRQLAEMVFAGTYALDIPPTNQPVEMSGGCTATDDFSIYAVWPHMHQLGIHQKVELVHDGRARMLHDAPFTFTEQSYDLMAPIAEVKAGDQVRVTCTYQNNTGQTVHWGDDQNAEMCFSGLYRYPAANTDPFACTSR
jgi:hypothetical protein